MLSGLASSIGSFFGTPSEKPPWLLDLKADDNIYSTEETSLKDRMTENPQDTVHAITWQLEVGYPINKSEILQLINLICEEKKWIDSETIKAFFNQLQNKSHLFEERELYDSSTEYEEFKGKPKGEALATLCYRALKEKKGTVALGIISLFSNSEVVPQVFEGTILFIYALEQDLKDVALTFIKRLPRSIVNAFPKDKKKYNELLECKDPISANALFSDVLNHKLLLLLKEQKYQEARGLVRDFPQGNLFVHTACKHGSDDVILYILKITKDFFCRDKEGHSPLDLIAQREDMDEIYIRFIDTITFVSHSRAENLKKLETEIEQLPDSENKTLLSSYVNKLILENEDFVIIDK